MNRGCFTCEHIMNEVITSIKAGWGKYELTIDGIKAFQCPKCGHTTYDIAEIEMIEKLSKALSELPSVKQPDYLNVKEVAETFRVSPQTVYNMIHDGRLSPIKMGREWRFISKDVISAFNPQSQQTAARGLGLSEKDKCRI